MNKYMLLILMSLSVAACSSQGEHYYLSNPSALQEALKKCPEKEPSALSCQQLEMIGKRMNDLAYQLQSSPQGFGSKIIQLQQRISSQENELEKNKKDLELKTNLERNKKELFELLAIVKWLESPENS